MPLIIIIIHDQIHIGECPTLEDNIIVIPKIKSRVGEKRRGGPYMK